MGTSEKCPPPCDFALQIFDVLFRGTVVGLWSGLGQPGPCPRYVRQAKAQLCHSVRNTMIPLETEGRVNCHITCCLTLMADRATTKHGQCSSTHTSRTSSVHKTCNKTSSHVVPVQDVGSVTLMDGGLGAAPVNTTRKKTGGSGPLDFLQ